MIERCIVDLSGIPVRSRAIAIPGQQSCASNVMQSIANGGTDLETVLATCPLPVPVEKK